MWAYTHCPLSVAFIGLLLPSPTFLGMDTLGLDKRGPIRSLLRNNHVAGNINSK